MKMLLKIEAVTKKLTVRMTAPRIQDAHSLPVKTTRNAGCRFLNESQPVNKLPTAHLRGGGVFRTPRVTSEPILDRAADLYIRGLRFILRTPTGIVCAVEKLQPEIKLRQHADGADPGNAHLGGGALPNA
jgi:hypothetical protein